VLFLSRGTRVHDDFGARHNSKSNLTDTESSRAAAIKRTYSKVGPRAPPNTALTTNEKHAESTGTCQVPTRLRLWLATPDAFHQQRNNFLSPTMCHPDPTIVFVYSVSCMLTVYSLRFYFRGGLRQGYAYQDVSLYVLSCTTMHVSIYALSNVYVHAYTYTVYH
jgi:hypothetical protein